MRAILASALIAFAFTALAHAEVTGCEEAQSALARLEVGLTDKQQVQSRFGAPTFPIGTQQVWKYTYDRCTVTFFFDDLAVLQSMKYAQQRLETTEDLAMVIRDLSAQVDQLRGEIASLKQQHQVKAPTYIPVTSRQVSQVELENKVDTPAKADVDWNQVRRALEILAPLLLP